MGDGLFKVAIEDELKLKRHQNDVVGISALSEIKLLVSATEAEERNALDKLGLKDRTHDLQEPKTVFLERQKWENEFDGRVYTRKEIKNLCLDYNLRILKSSNYAKSQIDTKAGRKIVDFCKAYKIDLDSYSAANNFYILAPISDFKKINRNSAPNNPVLFYKLDDEHYRIVHKWGSDFSILRYIYGFKERNGITAAVHWSTIITGATMVISGWLGGSPLGWGLGFGFASFFVLGMIFSSSDVKFQDVLWNEEVEYS